MKCLDWDSFDPEAEDYGRDDFDAEDEWDDGGIFDIPFTDDEDSDDL